MKDVAREMGRTIRYALESTPRTARLIAISAVMALIYLLIHLVN